MSAFGDMNEEVARSFAIMAHGDQRYGDSPYAVHLAAVRQVLVDYDIDGAMAVAAWLHDVVEDTAVKVEHIAASFGINVADLVWAVTGVGHNRRARNADAHAKIRAFAGNQAAILKLADRIANAEASARDPSRLAMYRKEQPAFEAMIHDVAAKYPRPLLGEMLNRLRRSLSVPAPRHSVAG